LRRGGLGSDLLDGDSGSDTVLPDLPGAVTVCLTSNIAVNVLGGSGGDGTLPGGEFSTDRFVYLATSDAPAGETIIDFDAGDLIDLSATDTNAGLAGDQAQADLNGDGVAEMFIALTGAVAMPAADFVL
jgi:Ca2+-binding RTX toxin-like protein